MVHADLFLCPIFTQRPMNDQEFEQSNEHSFCLKKDLSNFIENFISHEKKSVSSQ